MTGRVVHAWDMGLLHRWWHAQPKNVAERFVAHVKLHAAEAFYTVVCLDCEGPTWRHALLPSYKANRVDSPERQAIREQIKIATEILRSVGIKTLQVPEYEADDLLATVARRALGKGFSVVIYSGDKDLAQLLGDGVRLHDDRDWVTPEAIEKRFGVPPRLLRDYLAIVGDSSDNLPGVKGMGPAAAKKLLEEHGSVWHAHNRAKWEQQFLETKNQSKLLRKLLAATDDLYLSNKLVGLKNDAPIGGEEA